MDTSKGVHIRALWATLCDNRAKLPDVAQALDIANRHLIDGLLMYHQPQSCVLPFDALAFFGHFLPVSNLNMAQVSRALKLYWEEEFCGTLAEFTSIVQQDEHQKGLSRNLQNFYLDERLDLIRCVEHIIEASQISTHPQSEICQSFLGKYCPGQELKKSLFRQLAHLEEATPHPCQAREWHSANLKERITTLRCLFRQQLDAQDFLELLNSVNLVNTVPNFADLSELYESVLHVHSALLLKVLDTGSSQRFQELLPFRSIIEQSLLKLSAMQEYSPVLLAWVLITGTYGKRTAEARTLGNIAIQQKAVKVADAICKDPHFQTANGNLNVVVRSLMVDMFKQLIAHDAELDYTVLSPELRSDAGDFFRLKPALVPVCPSPARSLPLASLKEFVVVLKFENVDEEVRRELAETYFTNEEYQELIACGALTALTTELPARTAISALKKVRRSPPPNRSYRHSMICDIIKEYRKKLARFARVPESLESIIARTGYSSTKTTFMRSYGPPPNWVGPPPTISSEILIQLIPTDTLENLLIPLLEEIGPIYEVQLPIDDLTGKNRGFARVKFFNDKDAQDAVKMLDGYEYLQGKFLRAKMSSPNTRLLIHGLDRRDSPAVVREKLVSAGVKEYALPKYKTHYFKHEKIKGEKVLNCGACYLDFDSRAEAETALEKISSKNDKFTRNLQVGWADPPYAPDLSNVSRLLISGIFRKITKDYLNKDFESFGALPVEWDGKANFGFIPFKDHDDAVFAMQSLPGETDRVYVGLNLADPKMDLNELKYRLVDEAERLSRENQSKSTSSLSFTSAFGTFGISTNPSPTKRCKK